MQTQGSLMRGQFGNNKCYCVRYPVRTMPLPPSLCDKKCSFIIIIMKTITQRSMLDKVYVLGNTLNEKVPHALSPQSLSRESNGQRSPAC